MVVGDVRTGTEVLVIGSGPGGYVAAIRAAQLGLEVTLVEEESYGGTCLNHGCIPSKALITATDIAHEAGAATEMGVDADPSVDLARTVQWKDGVVEQLTSGVESLCTSAGVKLVQGRAEFGGPNSVRIIHGGSGEGAESIDFEHAIVATGSRPIRVPGFDYEDDGVLDSRAALSLETVPDRLIVVGGGYIGMELSTAFAKAGADVTVLEMLDSILPGYDDDITGIIRNRASELGIDIRCNHTVRDCDHDGEGLTVHTDPGDDDVRSFEADRVLVAAGRQPVTDTLTLENVPLEPTDDGFLETDDRMRTDLDNVYAVGDVAGEPMLAHTAMYEGRIAAEVIAGRPAAADARGVPAVVFTDPEIASVGMTSTAASDAGFEPLVGESPLRANGRALTLGDSDGFVRLVAGAEEEVIIGAQIVASEASELIGELGHAIEMGTTLEDLAATIHAHPTISEAIVEAADQARGAAIHTAN